MERLWERMCRRMGIAETGRGRTGNREGPMGDAGGGSGRQESLSPGTAWWEHEERVPSGGEVGTEWHTPSPDPSAPQDELLSMSGDQWFPVGYHLPAW